MKNQLFQILFFVLFIVGSFGQSLKQKQTAHKGKKLSNSQARYLANLSNTGYTNEILNNILIPRVVGTPNHEKVFNYIKSQLEDLQWTVEVDEFTDKTPNFGTLKFKNIVAKLNPNAERFLVLACHYDSKYFAEFNFVGATDSAVPCAMMLNLAKVMQKELNAAKNNNDLSLELVFFDGEEAFEEWGPKDSIYGARNLAKKMERNKIQHNGETISDLQRIDMLVLLDLIGHKGTTFRSHFSDTAKWFDVLARIEDWLTNAQLIEKPAYHQYFSRGFSLYGRIEDDHLPFLRKNVPILHLISTPFPDRKSVV